MDRKEVMKGVHTNDICPKVCKIEQIGAFFHFQRAKNDRARHILTKTGKVTLENSIKNGYCEVFGVLFCCGCHCGMFINRLIKKRRKKKKNS